MATRLIDAQIEGLSRVTRIIKDMGAVPAIQLGHTGRKGSEVKPWEGGYQLPPDHPDEWPDSGPSTVPYGGKYKYPVHALTRDLYRVGCEPLSVPIWRRQQNEPANVLG